MLRSPRSAARLASLALALAAPAAAAGTEPRGLVRPLRLEPALALALDDAVAARVLLAQDGRGQGQASEGDEKGAAQGEKKDGEGEKKDGAREGEAKPGLDFDLLGEPERPANTPDPKAMARRRKMLGWHQASGLALIGLQLSTTVLGQLNYNDKFGGSAPPNTGQYEQAHRVLAYSTLGAFVATGTLALLAPSPIKKPRRLDRVMTHRIAMFTAAAGMAAQAGLGIYTASREGYQNQEQAAQIHLAIGYATLAAVTVGVAALTL